MTNNDLIRRSDALECFHDWVDKHGDIHTPDEIAEYRAIEELPSVEQETAKRIVGKSRDGMTLWYQCDMCNEPVDAQDNFCRGCGRKLVDDGTKYI